MSVFDSRLLSAESSVSRDRNGRQVIAIDDIQNALKSVAAFIAEGDEQYLPIFLRLESELAARFEQEDALARARQFCVDNA